LYTFTDLMRQAHHGRMVENFASQFGLTASDTEKLMATMLPVYAMGLQKNLQTQADPFGVVALIKAGPFRQAYESFEAAVSGSAQDAGRDAMMRIFGSGDAAKAIADQVATITGVGTDIVNKMMPAMTSTLLGGIGKEIEESPLAGLMERWQTGFGLSPGKAPDTPFNPFTAPMEAFMKGFSDGKPAAAAPAPAPAAAPEPATPDPAADGLATLRHIFNAGLELQETNRKAFERILETYQQR